MAAPSGVAAGGPSKPPVGGNDYRVLSDREGKVHAVVGGMREPYRHLERQRQERQRGPQIELGALQQPGGQLSLGLAEFLPSHLLPKDNRALGNQEIGRQQRHAAAQRYRSGRAGLLNHPFDRDAGIHDHLTSAAGGAQQALGGGLTPAGGQTAQLGGEFLEVAASAGRERRAQNLAVLGLG